MKHSFLYIVRVCLIGAFALVSQTLYAQKNPQAVAIAIAREFKLTIEKEMGNLIARYRVQSQEALSSSQKTIYCISIDGGQSEIYFKSEGACRSACRDLERIIKNATIQLIRRAENEVGHKMSVDVNASFNKLIQGRITSKAVNNPNYNANSLSASKSSSTSYMTHRDEKLGIYANSQDRNLNQNRSNSQSDDRLKGGRPVEYFDYSDHSAEQSDGLIDGISSSKQNSSNQPQIDQKLATLSKQTEVVPSNESAYTPVLAAPQRTIGTSAKRLVDNTGEDRLGQTFLDGSTNSENQYQKNEHKLEQFRSAYDQLSKDKNSQKYYEQEDERTNLQIQMIDPALKNAIIRSQKERVIQNTDLQHRSVLGSVKSSDNETFGDNQKSNNDGKRLYSAEVENTSLVFSQEKIHFTGNEIITPSKFKAYADKIFEISFSVLGGNSYMEYESKYIKSVQNLQMKINKCEEDKIKINHALHLAEFSLFYIDILSTFKYLLKFDSDDIEAKAFRDLVASITGGDTELSLLDKLESGIIDFEQKHHLSRETLYTIINTINNQYPIDDNARVKIQLTLKDLAVDRSISVIDLSIHSVEAFKESMDLENSLKNNVGEEFSKGMSVTFKGMKLEVPLKAVGAGFELGFLVKSIIDSRTDYMNATTTESRYKTNVEEYTTRIRDYDNYISICKKKIDELNGLNSILKSHPLQELKRMPLDKKFEMAENINRNVLLLENRLNINDYTKFQPLQEK